MRVRPSPASRWFWLPFVRAKGSLLGFQRTTTRPREVERTRAALVHHLPRWKTQGTRSLQEMVNGTPSYDLEHLEFVTVD
jgi:hypothetical protein